MKSLIENISFKTDDNKLVEMFGDTAQKVAKKLNNGENNVDISTTQLRKFYEKILELNEKATALEEDDFKIKILPFVKMLNSKVQYSYVRKHCGNNFVTLMESSIKKTSSKEELQNFKYFLESIIGYMPKK
jgi:CRISPR-associated protein Csm2